MIRETEEEICITPTNYYKVGIMEYVEYYKGKVENILFHLYVATDWTGEPKESEEMQPYWFDIDKIPYDRMFEDDKYWLPYVLEGKKINGFFEFDEDWNLKIHRIEEIK
jgi:8-oxo-dGTP diphosphatase